MEDTGNNDQPSLWIELGAIAMAARAIKSGELDLIIPRGCRKHVACAFCSGKSRNRIQSKCSDIRYHDWLALRESGDAETFRNKFDARDCRERCRTIWRESGRSGRICLEKRISAGLRRTMPNYSNNKPLPLRFRRSKVSRKS